MSVKTVRMVRTEPQYPGGPTRCDVHPDEVDNYTQGGWVAEKPKTTRKAAPRKAAADK